MARSGMPAMSFMINVRSPDALKSTSLRGKTSMPERESGQVNRVCQERHRNAELLGTHPAGRACERGIPGEAPPG
jgi:hypothetical protein